MNNTCILCPHFFDWYSNSGHRIHVLFMMYDVYWYCQMKKKRMIMKILKKEWFIWKFWKKGGGSSREKGGGGNEIHAPCGCAIKTQLLSFWYCKGFNATFNNISISIIEQSGYHHNNSSKCNLFSPWYSGGGGVLTYSTHSLSLHLATVEGDRGKPTGIDEYA